MARDRVKAKVINPLIGSNAGGGVGEGAEGSFYVACKRPSARFAIGSQQTDSVLCMCVCLCLCLMAAWLTFLRRATHFSQRSRSRDG